MRQIQAFSQASKRQKAGTGRQAGTTKTAMPPAARPILRICLIGICLVVASACSVFRHAEVRQESSIESKTVMVERGILPEPQQASADTTLADTTDIDLDFVQLRLIRLPDLPRQDEADAGDLPRQNAPAERQNAEGKKEAPRFRIEALSKPDSLFFQVPQETKTITNTVTETKYEKRMPWWGWMLLGVAALLVLIGMLRR